MTNSLSPQYRLGYRKRFSPSKALQDAKLNLGPAYFDAKLIECPQNALELTKLRQNCEELDRQKHKAIEENQRSQRVLFHTLQSRYTFSKTSIANPANPFVRDNKLPPPGFRYHANGNPKLSLKHSKSMISHDIKPDEKSAALRRYTPGKEVVLQSTDINADVSDANNTSPSGSSETASTSISSAFRETASTSNSSAISGDESQDTVAIDYEKGSSWHRENNQRNWRRITEK